jgi:hypothetical protein
MKKHGDVPAGLRLAAVGLEAELSLVVDDMPATPERVFGNPRTFIRGQLRHRVGTSFQLPTGAAVYFDTGVIEVATPVIELERGCIARAGRSLWESICFIRGELDAWEARTGHTARLVGFSTHYNVSIEPGSPSASARRLNALSKLLTYVLPAPVMLLATNRTSTGVGVRHGRLHARSHVDGRGRLPYHRHHSRDGGMAVVHIARAPSTRAAASPRLSPDAAHLAQRLARALRLLSIESVRRRPEPSAPGRHADL